MRGQETGQFGSFDGLDTRREVLRLFQRMGDGEPEDVAAARRASFLSSLMASSRYAGLAGKHLQVAPCSPTQAYMEFVHITGVLGVPIDDAAIRLEEAAR